MWRLLVGNGQHGCPLSLAPVGSTHQLDDGRNDRDDSKNGKWLLTNVQVCARQPLTKVKSMVQSMLGSGDSVTSCGRM